MSLIVARSRMPVVRTHVRQGGRVHVQDRMCEVVSQVTRTRRMHARIVLFNEGWIQDSDEVRMLIDKMIGDVDRTLMS
jgi:hypothetical protein